MKATLSENPDVVREILKYHPDVNAHELNGESPLAFLLERGKSGPDTTKILRLLIAAGADVNSRDNSGQTPIFKACNHEPEAVRVLAQAGADLNAKDRFGHTALMTCFDRSFVQAMIEAGAAPTMKNPKSP